jgi:hypothetical protein
VDFGPTAFFALPTQMFLETYTSRRIRAEARAVQRACVVWRWGLALGLRRGAQEGKITHPFLPILSSRPSYFFVVSKKRWEGGEGGERDNIICAKESWAKAMRGVFDCVWARVSEERAPSVVS